MRSLLATGLLYATLCFGPAAAQESPSPAPVSSAAPQPSAAGRLPPCRVALAKLLTRLDSRENIAGDAFAFALDGPITADGTVPNIPVGTRGYGIIDYVDRSDLGGQPGRLIVEPRYLVLADGTHLQVTVDPERSEGFVQGRTRNLNNALQFIPGMGLVVNGYNAVHRGSEVDLAPGTTFRIIIGDALASGDCYVPRAPR